MKGHFRAHRWRKVTPDQGRAILAAYRAGANYRDLASAYDISWRTVYRVMDRAATEDIVTAHLMGFCAPFGIGDEGPVQLGPWTPVERTSELFVRTGGSPICDNEQVGSSDTSTNRMPSAPFRSLTLLNGVAASRGQD